MMEKRKKIWTIGHSTLSFPEFVKRLKSFKITLLADVRRFPGSRRFPHFNREELRGLLGREGIAYRHFENLGGRRQPKADSENVAWRNRSFRGYADYMETADFRTALGLLEKVALRERVAIMCSEAVWWRCHRALVADYLKATGWFVCHIMDEAKCSEHPFTTPARNAQGRLPFGGQAAIENSE